MTFNSSFVLACTTFAYGLGMVFYIGSFSLKKSILGKAGFWILVLGFVANTVGILLRWTESYQLGYGHAPFSNMYESLVFFSWTAVLLHIILEFRHRGNAIGPFVALLVFLSMAYASFDPEVNNQITPLIPALKSNWLIAHVITCFLGYAGFAVAFGFSIMFLIKPTNTEETSIFAKLPDADVIDELTYQMIVFGFLFLTIGIITGSVWANSAWGRYWSWDPKETWALVTWLVYAIFMHLRLTRGWNGKHLAFVSIVGFMAVLFTYFGVNYLLSGLHSYA